MNKQKNSPGNNLPPSGGGGAFGFLFKPFFFICSLLFATWLVLYIERIRPSDLGKYESLFNNTPKPVTERSAVQISPGQQQSALTYRQKYLKKLCEDYKAGLIDSTTLEKKIAIFLESEKGSNKSN